MQLVLPLKDEGVVEGLSLQEFSQSSNGF